jgi:hypothetical protein
VFRRHRGADDILGGGSLPVVQDGNGTWVVHTMQLESAIQASFDSAFSGLASLDSKIREAREVAARRQGGATPADFTRTDIRSLVPLVSAARRPPCTRGGAAFGRRDALLVLRMLTPRSVVGHGLRRERCVSAAKSVGRYVLVARPRWVRAAGQRAPAGLGNHSIFYVPGGGTI